mmetsp:Transcript_7225/g.16023  ORF Transcript_7225/g.16023 Transcript_7225/m.16023 type:complete len:380 (-) Transcript_7225:277-1416(-)
MNDKRRHGLLDDIHAGDDASKSESSSTIQTVAKQKLGLLLRQIGIRSSSEARHLLSSRRVLVDGVLESSFARQIPANACVQILGSPAEGALARCSIPYLVVMNKPCGVLTTLADEHGRPDLHDAIETPLMRKGLHPIGRLDCHSTGLLLWTTDGRLTRCLLDPEQQVPREYECVVKGRVLFPELQRMLASGVVTRFSSEPFYAELHSAVAVAHGTQVEYEHASCSTCDRRDDGPLEAVHKVAVAECDVLDARERNAAIGCNADCRDGPVFSASAECSDSCQCRRLTGLTCNEDELCGKTEREKIAAGSHLSIVRVVVREGKNRMVRRMLAHCGHPVINLRRVAFGDAVLGHLKRGEARLASAAEASWAQRVLLKALYER